MVKKLDYLTATDFFKYITCPHWPWFDRFATAKERALKRPLSPGEQRRLDDGYAHEAEVMSHLTKGHAVEMMKETGSPESLARAAVQAMEEGAPYVYQGTLFDGRWLGRPDLLMRVPGASKLGNWHYVPVDVKTAHDLKASHRHQLTFYALLLEKTQGLFPEKAAIVNGDGDWHWFDPATNMTDFRDILQKLEALLSGDKPDLVLRKACFDTSPWGAACQAQAEKADDIALLYNVDMRKLDALRLLGIATVADAADLNVDSLADTAPGLSAHALEGIKMQAVSLRDKTVFIKKPVDLPESACEIFFDIESDPPNDVDYLYGFLTREDGRAEYRMHLAPSPSEEKTMWKSFLEHIASLPPEYVVYHYASYETTRLRILEGRYGGSKWLELFLSRMIDLKPYATKHVTYPLYFYGLKYICRELGFRWRSGIASGGESIDWYEKWCETGNRALLDDIVTYNEDDVRATAFLKDWLTTYAPELAAYEKPYPWAS
jgi:uncharacterized protein